MTINGWSETQEQAKARWEAKQAANKQPRTIEQIGESMGASLDRVEPTVEEMERLQAKLAPVFNMIEEERRVRRLAQYGITFAASSTIAAILLMLGGR